MSYDIFHLYCFAHKAININRIHLFFFMTNLFTNFFVTCDAARPWGIYFQDSASPEMEALIELHDNIMFYLAIISFGMAWILISVVRNYANDKYPISNKYLNHGTLIELIWTITPALILILIAFPSFKLLYLMDEVTDPSITLFVEGHQWYWSYQYPDFVNDDDEEFESNTFLSSDEGSEDAPDIGAGGSDTGDEASDTGAGGSEAVSDATTLDTPNVLSPEDERIANCLHENLIPYNDYSMESIDNATCDFNPERLADGRWVNHSAFRGSPPYHCNDCDAIICGDCRN